MEPSELGAWAPLLEQEWNKPYFYALRELVEQAYRWETVYPPREEIFAALRLTEPSAVRVVILGQDPYHEPGQAHGLAFSVREGTALPPSLRNILRELADDTGTVRTDGDLTDWAEQGVLLLNTVLTVTSGRANSHRLFGWETFTDAVIRAVGSLPQPVCFVLWGSQAQKKAALLPPTDAPRRVIRSPHPSPLSAYRGFFGSRPFSRVNEFLRENNEPQVRW